MIAVLAMSACAPSAPGMLDAPDRSARLVEGPPIEGITTPGDTALMCLSGKIDSNVSFAVGQIVDSTGKESFSEGGTGKFISQGVGEMAQSALFRAGVTVVNRRDPNIPISETNWGIRNINSFQPATFYVTGSINSLDFIPGGGATMNVNGMGPRARQDRLLIGFDLAMTDAFSGVLVSNVSLQKQIYAREIGFSVDSFFGTNLVGFEIGMKEREAIHLALRQMVNLAMVELMRPVLGSRTVSHCQDSSGAIREDLGFPVDAVVNPRITEIVAKAADRADELNTAAMNAASGAAPAAAPPKPAPAAMSPKAIDFGRQATILAARAISAAERSFMNDNPQVVAQLAGEAATALQKAVQALREGAGVGLSGAEGDGAALIIEQAVAAVMKAQQRAEALKAAAEAAPAPPVVPPAGADGTAQPRPGTPEYEQRGGG